MQVFLCHSSGDKERVRQLYNRLRVASFDPWLDTEKLHGGHEWKLEIKRAIRRSGVVVICLSNDAITKEGYVQREVKEALEVAAEKPPGTIFIIPLRIEECELPDSLSDYHAIDYYREDGFERLLESLTARKAELDSRTVSSPQTSTNPSRRRWILALMVAVPVLGLAAQFVSQKVFSPTSESPPAPHSLAAPTNVRGVFPPEPEPEPETTPPITTPTKVAPRGAGDESGVSQPRAAPADEGRTRLTPTAPPATIPPTTATTSSAAISDCPAEATDRPPGITLAHGDVVIVAGSIFRIDSKGQSTRILSSEFLSQTRATAVEPDGNILLATMACGQGLVVRVDPRTGTQTPVVSGFRAPVGLFVEEGGETVLVGDENRGHYGANSWGALVRVNLKSGERTVLHVFYGSDAATGIAVHPKSQDIYFTARGLYRIDRKVGGVARRVDVDGIGAARAIVITPNGEIYVGDSERRAVLRVDLTTSQATELIGNHGGFSGGWIGLAYALDGKSLVVGAPSTVTTIPLPPAAPTSKELWTGSSNGLGVFVAVVD